MPRCPETLMTSFTGMCPVDEQRQHIKNAHDAISVEISKYRDLHGEVECGFTGDEVVGRIDRVSGQPPGGGLKAIRSSMAQSTSTLTKRRMLEASALVVDVGKGQACPRLSVDRPGIQADARARYLRSMIASASVALSGFENR